MPRYHGILLRSPQGVPVCPGCSPCKCPHCVSEGYSGPFWFPCCVFPGCPFHIPQALPVPLECPCHIPLRCACSYSVLTEVLPGPPVVLDAYERVLELGQELDLIPGPLSALLGIVRQTIIMCTGMCRARRGWEDTAQQRSYHRLSQSQRHPYWMWRSAIPTSVSCCCAMLCM